MEIFLPRWAFTPSWIISSPPGLFSLLTRMGNVMNYGAIPHWEPREITSGLWNDEITVGIIHWYPMNLIRNVEFMQSADQSAHGIMKFSYYYIPHQFLQSSSLEYWSSLFLGCSFITTFIYPLLTIPSIIITTTGRYWICSWNCEWLCTYHIGWI